MIAAAAERVGQMGVPQTHTIAHNIIEQGMEAVVWGGGVRGEAVKQAGWFRHHNINIAKDGDVCSNCIAIKETFLLKKGRHQNHAIVFHRSESFLPSHP